MLPVIAGAAIAAGASALGGALSNRANRKAMARQEAFQREFAQHGVRWRVEDAKQAGVHPLYALGAQLPSASPMVIPDSMGPALSEAGQSLGSAVASRQTPQELAAYQANMRLVQAQIGETDARRDYYIAEAARTRQESMAATTFPLADPSPPALFEQYIPEGQAPRGINEVVPAAVVPGSKKNPNIMSGQTPMFREFLMPNGRPVLLPGGVSGDASEALESLGESPILMGMVYMANREAYGEAYARELLETYLPGGTQAASAVDEVTGWPLTNFLRRMLSDTRQPYTAWRAMRERSAEASGAYYRARDQEY